jgi:hypothetical protein
MLDVPASSRASPHPHLVFVVHEIGFTEHPMLAMVALQLISAQNPHTALCG